MGEAQRQPPDLAPAHPPLLQITALTSSLASSPATTFPSSFTTAYGISSMSATVTTVSTPPSPPSGDSSSPSAPLLSTGAIIGIAVGGGVVLVLLIVLVVLCSRSGRQVKVLPEAGSPGRGAGGMMYPVEPVRAVGV